MAEFETIWEDEKAWTRYVDDEGEICVYRRCPECGKYLKDGEVRTNMAGAAKLHGWTCKKHGEVTPFYIID